VVPDEWSTVLVLHYSRTVAVCPHNLHALTALPVHTSCMPMIALMLGALKICTHALRKFVASCTDRTARLLFMLESHGPQGAIGHVAAPEPISVGR
jgi:hypothetical protein